MIKFKNSKRIYAICSIVTILSLGLTACSSSEKKTATNGNEPAVQQKNVSEANTTDNKSEDNKSNKPKSEVKSINKENATVPKISKKQLEKGTKATFSTPWKSSANETFSVCIEGKGQEAKEEGIGKIFLRDNNNEDIFSFEILDNTKLSPTAIEWADDKNLLVIIGSAHGTIGNGGNLYLLNVSTGKMSSVLQAPDKKQKIMTAKKSGSNIALKVNVFDDDAFNKSHTENWTISSFDTSLSKQMKVQNSEGKLLYVINGDN